MGYRPCFYRRIPVGALRDAGTDLDFTETAKTFDLREVYGDAPNPTLL